jgi:hypothetical protein
VIAQRADAPDEAETYDVGVLFIHGIGAQRRGHTLAEFGGHLYHWLTDRYRGLDQRWREAIDADSGDPEAAKMVPETEVEPAAEGRAQEPRSAVPRIPTQHPAAGGAPSTRATLIGWRAKIEAWATDGFHREDLQEDRMEPCDSAPLARLAEQLGNTVVGRVRLKNALLNDSEDPTAPAHAELLFQRQRIAGNVEAERWLLAESWWAETFSPPSFGELTRWGLRIIPWAVGNHFGAQIRYCWAQRPRGTAQNSWWKQAARWLGWLWRALAAAVRLVIGLLASPLLLAGLAALLLVALLPIPQVRDALLKIQLSIASTLGDSYMLATRPIEAAAIVTQVQRDISWLTDRCKVVAVVAHSQGGAVAHKALQGGVPLKLKLLFTFGSGLKKLEQLEHILSSRRTYIRSAIITLIAMVCFGLTFAWLVWTVVWRGEQVGSTTALTAVYALLALAFLVAGVRDHVREIELRDLRRWVERLKKKLDWVDCFTVADPVSNGLLLHEPSVEESSQEVCNLSSTLSDHTSYWKNRDHFVTLLIGRLTQPKLRQEAGLHPAPELTTPNLHGIAMRRVWRVGILRSIRWAAALSVVFAVWLELETWWNFLIYLANLIFAWAAGLVSGESRPANDFAFSWRALAVLALALVLYRLTRWRWRAWDESEMRALVEGWLPPELPDLGVTGTSPTLAMGLFLQLAIAVYFLDELLSGGMIEEWGIIIIVVPVLFLVTFGLIEFTQPPSSSLGKGKPKPPVVASFWPIAAASGEALPAYAGHVILFGLLVAILGLAFIIGTAAWEGFVWLAESYFYGSILGFRPSEVPGLAGAAVFTALVLVLGFVLVRVWPKAPTPPDHRRRSRIWRAGG